MSAIKETITVASTSSSSQTGSVLVESAHSITYVVDVTAATGTLDIQPQVAGDKSAARWADYGSALATISGTGTTSGTIADVAAQYIRFDYTIGTGPFAFTIDVIQH